MNYPPFTSRFSFSLTPLTLSLTLAACGGGGDSDPQTVTLDGQVIKGPMVGAAVVAYQTNVQ